ncbi:diacylglycerol kinase family protein [Gangjinia marincola]|uniref:Diacylglycerol kinase family protein n=1 Tax=Gangjinia marincola TaxID=578463 RepID=A0ABN1MG29_9FLAO
MSKNFIVSRIKSVGYAAKGAWLLIKNEPSIKVQSIIAVIVTIAGFLLDISREEWMLQFLAIGLVMGVEGVNTAIEKTADFIHPDFDTNIGQIKDIAAGAVFIAAIIAIAIGMIIYLPKLV